MVVKMKKDKFRRTLVIGDIHGCFYTLMNLLEEANYNKHKDRIIFLGDYIDRGNYNKMVMDYLISLQEEVGTDMAICIKGNHEKMFLHYVWKFRKKPYNKNTASQLKDDIEKYSDWIMSLPTHFVEGDYIFVHGGVPHGVIEDNTEDDFVWTYRSQYTNLTDKVIICGHLPAKEIYNYDDIIGIDTGCCFNNMLSVLIIHSDNILSYIRVRADERDINLKKEVEICN